MDRSTSGFVEAFSLLVDLDWSLGVSKQKYTSKPLFLVKFTLAELFRSTSQKVLTKDSEISDGRVGSTNVTFYLL